MTKDNSSNDGCVVIGILFWIVWIANSLIRAHFEFDSFGAYFHELQTNYFHCVWMGWRWMLEAVVFVALIVCCYLCIIRPILQFFGLIKK